ncbi:MAG: amidohydrolase [Halioglobus sp.]
MRDLNVSLVQCELAWEKPEDNRAQIGEIIDSLGPTDLIVLPEMFTTGFSMKALANLEPASGGATQAWMQDIANRKGCAVTGSIATQYNDKAYNRMLFATKDAIWHYDKKHLFAYAGEHKRYASGNERVIVEYQGWRICLQVCYDLRFPVFCRNQNDYDLLLFVANWPDTRSLHWRTLLQARAIENQACVVGVNRVGSDANGLNYQGDSLAISPDGTVILDCGNKKNAAQVSLSGADLQRYRQAFPFQSDADPFQLL